MTLDYRYYAVTGIRSTEEDLYTVLRLWEDERGAAAWPATSCRPRSRTSSGSTTRSREGPSFMSTQDSVTAARAPRARQCPAAP
jgi:hypothetical protein